MKFGHKEIKEMLPEYLKGSLPEDMKRDVKAHLKKCQECKEEASFLSELVKIDVPDPGGSFYKTLPQKVKVKEEKAGLFSLRFLFSPMPIAAAVIAILALVFTFAMIKKEAFEFDPFFNDPLEVAVLDYGNMTERDIPIITERLNGDGSYILSDGFMEHSYQREFASLSSRDLRSLYEVLKNKQER